MAHIRQSRPDSGLGVQVEAIETFQVVLSSPGSSRGHLRKPCTWTPAEIEVLTHSFARKFLRVLADCTQRAALRFCEQPIYDNHRSLR